MSFPPSLLYITWKNKIPQFLRSLIVNSPLPQPHPIGHRIMWVAVCDGACQPPYLEGKSANIFGFLRAMNGDILSPITSCTDALQTRKEIELIYDKPKSICIGGSWRLSYQRLEKKCRFVCCYTQLSTPLSLILEVIKLIQYFHLWS